MAVALRDVHRRLQELGREYPELNILFRELGRHGRRWLIDQVRSYLLQTGADPSDAVGPREVIDLVTPPQVQRSHSNMDRDWETNANHGDPIHGTIY